MTATAVEPLRTALVDCIDRLGLRLSATQVDDLLAYLALLQRWNNVYNLTAVRDPAAMLSQHLADCLAIVGPLQREIGASPASLLDVGSGGGLPAVVIAAALPTVTVTSVDSVGKKAAFVQQVAGELKLENLHAVHARVESLDLPGFDVITSRAFSTLDQFTRLTRGQSKPETRWLAMKGKLPNDEIVALSSAMEVFHVEPLAVPGLAADRCIVWIRRKSPSL